MKIITTFLIINENNENISTFLKGYETSNGWFKEVNVGNQIRLKKTTEEEILLLSKKMEKNLK